MKNIFVIVGSILIATSCTQIGSIKTFERIAEIDAEKSTKISFDEKFELINKIKLETTNESLLGDIKHVKIIENEYYILTDSYTNGLYKFNQEGKFDKKITKNGRGPSESGYIQNFTNINDTLYLYDSEKLAIWQYDLFGKELGLIKNVPFSLDLTIDSNNRILYSGYSISNNANYRIHFTDNDWLSNGNDFLKFPTKHADFINISPSKIFSNNTFLEPFGTGIYRIENNKITPLVELNFGSFNMTEEFVNKGYSDIADFLISSRKERYAFLFANYQNTKTTLSFTFEHNERRLLCLINQDDLSSSVIRSIEIKIDKEIYTLKPSDFPFVGTHGDMFIATIYPQTLIDGSGNSRMIQDEYEDNPTLYIFKTRE